MTDSPQLENGYIRIANELYQAIWGMPFTHQQHKVIFAIIAKTYGFNKKEDDVSASQLGAFCGMNRTHVTRTLNELEKMNVISKKPGVYGSIVGIQKDYKKWIFTSTKSAQVNQIGTSTKSVQGVPNRSLPSTKSVQVDSTKSVHTKDNLPKDNKQKTCASAFERFWKAYPKKKSKGQAEKTFARINPNEQLLSDMLAGIERAKTSDQWQNEKGRYIPYPATWLNAKGWQDEDCFGGDWWTAAGFKTKFEAENAGFNEFNVNQAAAEAL